MARRKSRRCKFGRVRTGPRKGRCRTRKLTGAAARAAGRKGRKKSSRKRSSKRRCKFGVNQRTGACLKHKRRRRRR